MKYSLANIKKTSHKNRYFSFAVFILILAFLGMAIYNTNRPTNKGELTSESTNQEASILDNETSQNAENQFSAPPGLNKTKLDGYLVIDEWGIKLQLKDFDKVFYTYEDRGENNYGTPETITTIKVKSEFLQNKDCNAGINWSRGKNLDPQLKAIAVRIGDYYYVSGSTSYDCGNVGDNDLNKRLQKDFVKIEAL